MNTGKGIAIAGMWVAAAISSFTLGLGAVIVFVCAMVGTMMVAESD